MGASRTARIGLGVMAAVLAACNALIGLDPYQNVACAFDCGADVETDSFRMDAPEEPDGTSPGDGGGDVLPTPDGDNNVDSNPDVVTPEGGWPVPTLHELWAHWPMPNPDAAIAPEASVLLPNPMSYDAGPEASTIAYDNVTALYWSRVPYVAKSYDEAWTQCKAIEGTGWRVPTRIELVSLIDFTQPAGSPTIDPAVFPTVLGAPTWTSSAFAGEDGPYGYWAVDFGTGLTANAGSATSQVLCVNGGTQ